MKRIILVQKILVLMVMLFGLVNATRAGQDNDALRRATQATVRIFSGAATSKGGFRGQCQGSGVIISAKGLVLTTHQTICDAEGRPQPELWAGLVHSQSGRLMPHRAVRLKVIAANAAQNIALLQLVANVEQPVSFPFLKPANASEITYGSPVTVLGAASGGGLQIGQFRTVVVEFDDKTGWVMLDGTPGAMASGAPVVNDKGELFGIQMPAQGNHQVTFFSDDDYPQGTLSLGEVSYFRSIGSILGFLLEQPNPEPEWGLARPPADVKVIGNVKDKQTGKPIPGAVIGVAFRRALAQDNYISANELMGYGRSSFQGGFEINRPIRAGRYLVKVVHPQYKTLVLELDIETGRRDFTVELVRN